MACECVSVRKGEHGTDFCYLLYTAFCTCKKVKQLLNPHCIDHTFYAVELLACGSVPDQ